MQDPLRARNAASNPFQPNAWNTGQTPVASVTPASPSFWPPAPLPFVNNSAALPPSPRALSVGLGMPLREEDTEEASRGRSRSTSSSVVLDLLMKTTTGQRTNSTRTASQPPHSAGLNLSAPPSSRPPGSARPRMPSLNSSGRQGEGPISISPGTASTLADLHDDEPLSASFPTARSPSQPLWSDTAASGTGPQRSPLLDRHFSLLNQTPTSANGNGIRAGTSLPTSNWSVPARGRPPGSGTSPPSLGRARELSPAAGGIGYSNMSPFTRDGGRQLPPFGASPGSAAYSHRPREHSVSVIGSGRRESSTLNGPAWNGAVEEAEEDEVHPPTKSGTTSRRHSLAVLPPRPAQVSHGFSMPAGSAPTARPEPLSAGALGYGRSRAMGFTDDELSADLNSLQLSLESAPSQSSLPFASSPSRSTMPNYSTSPGINAAAAARAYFAGETQQSSAFSPFASSQAASRGPQQRSSMPPYATAAPSTYPSQQSIDLMGPPVYFGAQTHPQPELVDLGKGLPMHHIPAGSLLYFCEFKAGRTDLFYVADTGVSFQKGDLVIVEADRGKDLGRVVHDGVAREEVLAFQKHSAEMALGYVAPSALEDEMPPHAQTLARMVKEIHPKQIYGMASPGDVSLLATKQSDEAKALMIVRAKVEARQMPMALTDAEWQIDRRKLTIFYVASRRIDFRELVRELFKVFKTRIWFSPVERQLEGPTPLGALSLFFL